MADNVIADPGTGGATFATDDIGGVHYPITKITIGALDSQTLLSGGNGATDAGTVRVTVSSDSTGVLSVDDNGGSLTVDATALDIRALTNTDVVTAELSAVDNAVLDTIASPVATISATPLQRVAIFDASDTQITSFGGGTQYAVDTALGATPTGTLAIGIRDDALSALTPVEGDAVGLRVDANGALWTIPSGTTTVGVETLPNGLLDSFGNMTTGGVHNQIDIQFFRDTPANLVTVNTAGTGTATATGGMATFASGASSGGSAQGQTNETTQYTAGGEIYSIFTAAFTGTGSSDTYQRIGLYDTNNGFFIGDEGGTFGVTTRSGASDTQVAKASWSEDDLTGGASSKFTRNGTPEAIDLTKLNVWRIRLGWVGSAPIRFEVLSPDGEWVTFHKTLQPNLSAVPSIEAADLPFTCDVDNNTVATNISVLTNCWAAGTTQDYGQLDATLTDKSFANLSRSVIVAKTAGGTYTNVASTNNGNFKIALDEYDGVPAGGGTEAGSLRVTIASDSTGLLSVDDGGGSLTVDGTVAVSGTVTVDGSGVTQPISAASLPLPTGAATEATLGTIDTDTGNIAAGYAVEGSALGSGVLIQGDDGTDRTNVLVDTDGHLQVDILSGGGGGTQDTEDDAIAAGQTVGINVAMNYLYDGTDWSRAASGTGVRTLQTQRVTIATDDVVPASQSGTWNITNVSGTISLPTGAATEATLAIVETNTDYGTVTGGGTEAGALRVTIANDSTGLVSVDDGGGALTVDNGGTFATQVDGAALTALQLIDDTVVSHAAAAASATDQISLEGRSTEQTAVDNGDAVRALATLLGKQVTIPYAIPGSTWSYASVAGGITDTADDVAKAAAGAGIRNYVTSVQVINGHDTVGTEVVIKDGSTIIWRGWAEQTGGGVSAKFDPPLRGTSNTAVNVTNITTGSATYFNLQGFEAAE